MTEIKLNNNSITGINTDNAEKLFDLLFDIRANIVEKLPKVLQTYEIEIAIAFNEDAVYETIIHIIQNLSRADWFNYKKEDDKLYRNTIKKFEKMNLSNKYVQYIMFYCKYRLNDYSYLDHLINYIKLGGKNFYTVEKIIDRFDRNITKETYTKLIELLNAMQPRQANEILGSVYNSTYISAEYNIGIIDRLQKENDSLKTELANTKRRHEEEIKELLIPGNKGALAAESRFKETSNTIDSLGSLDSLDN